MMFLFHKKYRRTVNGLRTNPLHSLLEQRKTRTKEKVRINARFVWKNSFWLGFSVERILDFVL